MFNLKQLSDLFIIFPKPIVILDLETTGGHFFYDRITEIALLHFNHGKVTQVEQLIQPEQTIPPFIEHLTGISDDMVANAPLFADFLPQILPLLRGSIMIAHNSRFDYNFLRYEAQRAGVDLGLQTLCSVQLSRCLYPAFHKHNLDAIIERHHLLKENRHRAMNDVLNLAYFLQASLIEHGKSTWLQEANRLIQPMALPDDLPMSLRSQLEALPDCAGVSVWYNANDTIQAVFTHEMAYREMPHLLSQNHTLVKQSERMIFHSAVGSLHSQFIQAQIMLKHHIPINGNSQRHSLIFDLDSKDGCLKARIRLLKNGFYSRPPCGLFMNPKAAKRALNKWSKAHGICLTQLGMLPHDIPLNSPCPARLVSGCVSACETQDPQLHNRRVQAALSSLPIVDWFKTPRFIIKEHDEISGKTHEFIFDSGALKIAEDCWFVSPSILQIIKYKLKNQLHQFQAA